MEYLLAISLVVFNISVNEIMYISAVSFTSVIASLPRDGSTLLIACGRRIYHIFLKYEYTIN